MKNKVFAFLFAEEIGFRQQLVALLLGLALTICVLTSLGLFHNMDLSKPLAYSGDAIEALGYVKDIVNEDASERLYAPFGYNLSENFFWKTIHLFFYPSIVLIIKLIGCFRDDPVKVINIYYILTYFITSMAFIYTVMHLRVPILAAVPLGLLYSFLPYHYLRGVTHLYPMSYYSVPLISLILIWIWWRDPPFFQKIDRKYRLDVLNYRSIFSVLVLFFFLPTQTYFNFFGAYLAIVSGISAALYRKNLIYLLSGVLVAGLMFASLHKEDLYISIYSFFNKDAYVGYVEKKAYSDRSQPISLAGDSEIYALKPVQLIIPAKEHRVEALKKFQQFYVKISRFGYIGTSAIGIIGSIGLFYLLFSLLYVKERKPLLYNQLTILNIFAVLLATVGGLGGFISIISNYYLAKESQLSQARAYNRMSVFIAFFSLLAIGILLTKLYKKIIYRSSGQKPIKILGVVIAIAISCIVFVFGIYDQVTPKAKFTPHEVNQYTSNKNFVHKIEEMMDEGARIFQLPFVIHHPSSGLTNLNRMFYADHLMGYIHSKHLKWTYGGDSGTFQTSWYKYTASSSPENLLKSLFLYDFDGILIDKFGFKDMGKELETDLKTKLGFSPMKSADNRYTFFDISGEKNQFIQSHSWSELNQMKKEVAKEISRLVPPTRDLIPLKQYEQELARHGKIDIKMTENTPHTTGKLMLMADGAEVMASGIGQPGALVYGPYWQLPKGHYRATFVIRTTKDNRDSVGTLKVTKFNDFKEELSVITVKEVIGPTPGDWQQYSLDFTIPLFSEADYYEFVVNSNGQGQLIVRDILLEKLS